MKLIYLIKWHYLKTLGLLFIKNSISLFSNNKLEITILFITTNLNLNQAKCLLNINKLIKNYSLCQRGILIIAINNQIKENKPINFKITKIKIFTEY